MIPLWCWLSVAATPPPRLIERVQLDQQVTELRYHSGVLDRALNLLVVTPQDAPGPAGLPVVFCLHGLGRNARTLFEQETTRASLLAARVVTVHPSGLAGWYLDSRSADGPAYQQALTEAIELATAQFGLTTNPARRGLGGWSMGGFGAARYAVDHPGEFAALGTIVGLLDFPNANLPADQNHSVPAHFGPAEGWPQLTPLAAVEPLSGWAHWQATGDRAFDRTMNERWSARLAELGAAHSFQCYEGGHTYAVVAAALPELLAFFAQALTGGDG